MKTHEKTDRSERNAMTSSEAADRPDLAHRAAERLREAAALGLPCAPVRDLLGPSDIALAYEVQQIITNERLREGARIVGRKIGLTSPAVQQQMGVYQPDFGVLFADMNCREDRPVPSDRLIQPRAEAEIAFVLGDDLIDGDLDLKQVRDSAEYAVASLEIVDSRVLDWNIHISDTIADNASSGLFVLGSERVTLDQFHPEEVTMSLRKDGVVVSEGNGEACLGNPLKALSWLARTARDFGSPLRVGDIVLSGALGPVVAVEPGSNVTADISSLGTVSATFSG